MCFNSDKREKECPGVILPYIFGAGITILIIFFCNIAESKETDLVESFIAFQTSKTSGDKFYRVMVNEEECPYLDLKDVIERHLGLSAEIDLENRRCEVNIVAAGGLFKIDGKKNTFYSIDRKGLRFKRGFIGDKLRVHDKRLWIKYDLLSKWIPIKITWELDRYYMRFMPEFPLLKDIIEGRERTRENNKARLLKKKILDGKKAFEPEENFNTEIRIKLKETLYKYKSDDGIKKNSYFAFDLNSDIYKGTLKLNGLITNNEEYGTDSNYIWKYKRENNRFFNLFEAGNLYNSSSLLNSSIAVQNGFNFKKLPEDEGKTGFDFQGVTQPGTEIDIFINGFIAGTIKTDDGKYNFKNFQVTGGQVVLLKFYFSDGSTKTEIYQVTSDAGKIIPKGLWDYQLFGGSEENNDDNDDFLGFSNLRYGVLDNLTFSGVYYHYTDTEVTGFGIAYKPVPEIFAMSEHLFAENTMGNAVSLELNYPPDNLKFESRIIDEDSPLIDLQSTEKRYPEYSFIRYSRNIQGWYLNFQYTDTTGYSKYQSTIKKRVFRYLSLSLENSLKQYKEGDTEDLSTDTIGAEFIYKRHNFRLNYSIDSHQNISYRYQPGRNSKYYITASCNHYEDNDEWDAFVNFTYKINDFISSSVSLSDTYNKVEGSIEGIIADEKGPDKSDQFALGTLYGKVELSSDAEHPSKPLSGVTVLAGSKKGITDEKGFYMITGLPVNQRITVRIMTSSMELGLTPKDDFTVVKFRPGTKIKYSPEIQRTVGIDGSILCDFEIKEGSKIHAVDAITDKVVVSGEVDPDGFFVIEGVVPGYYHFVFERDDKNKYSFNYRVVGDKDWISNVIFKIKGNK